LKVKLLDAFLSEQVLSESNEPLARQAVVRLWRRFASMSPPLKSRMLVFHFTSAPMRRHKNVQCQIGAIL